MNERNVRRHLASLISRGLIASNVPAPGRPASFTFPFMTPVTSDTPVTGDRVSPVTSPPVKGDIPPLSPVTSPPVTSDILTGKNRKPNRKEPEPPRVRATLHRSKSDEPPPSSLDMGAWHRWEQYRSQIRKPIKQPSIAAAQRKLAGYGADQPAVVEQSIANGWQGLFPLKATNGIASNGLSKAQQQVRNTVSAAAEVAMELFGPDWKPA